MSKSRRLTSIFLAVVMLLAMMSGAAFAAVSDTGFSDVAAGTWYADAVKYVRDNGIMNGTGTNTFGPDEVTSRGQIVTILYQAAGKPAVTNENTFPDVAGSDYFADAVKWASANNIVSGYPDGTFGPNDPITREQMAFILWRYDGSPAAEGGQDFADESSISAYASAAVDWARANGIISGENGNRFNPAGNANRAQAAVILYGYRTKKNEQLPPPQTPDTNASKTLVVYYSASGNTGAVAKTLAETMGADLFELVPAEPYTDADLDWTKTDSRVNREHENEALREVKLAANTAPNWSDYDTVFVGYPIWWGIAAWPVNDFVKNNDFTGKKVIPFCTSTSSGLGQSGELLSQMAGTGDWQDGHRFSSRPSQTEVQNWASQF